MMDDETEKPRHDGKVADEVAITDAVRDIDREAIIQAPLPLSVNPAPPAAPLNRLDSQLPEEKAKDGEEETDPFAHLPENEQQILKRQLDIPPVKVGFFDLYRFATRNDLIIVSISALAAIIGGALMPLMTVIFGSLAGTFQGYFQGTESPSGFESKLGSFTLYFVYLAIADFAMIFVATAGFNYTGEHITGKIREEFLAAILRQNIGFFDKLGAGEITTRITADTNLVQDGISGKVALTLTAVATFVSAFVVGFVRYWKLTLILSSSVVAIVASMGIIGRLIPKYEKLSLAQYAEGGTLAEEVLSSIRNAVAFNAQDKLSKKYAEYLAEAEKSGFKSKAVLGSLIGILYMYIYLNYGLSFWEGSRLLVAGDMTLSQVITIQLSIMIGAFSLGNVAPNAAAISTAISAASKIYATIDRPSPVDPDSPAGEKLTEVEGTLELRNIKHVYPSRPEVVVMEDVSLHIPAGKSTALVGASGSGKSTIVGLVERFYDPVKGEVFLDGHEIKTLNLRWLRQQISLVSQEPTLFATTIYENIAHGLIGTKDEGRTKEEVNELVENAARMANAHDFISDLPEGYNTHVGERGFLMSGGQKQRIAIARAVVSDPRILLLDEATSALDTKSEGVVQAALDKAAIGRTTIVIAHRLSTIKNADNIVVMSQGRIVEQGTHHELLAKRTAYYNLVEAQQIAAAKEARQIKDEEKAIEQEAELDAQVSGPGKKAESSSSSDDAAEAEKGPNALERVTTGKSVSSVALQKKKPQEETNYSLWTLVKVIGKFNRPEWYWMLLGLGWCIVGGGGDPVSAVFFAKSIQALSLPPADYGELRSQANFWALMYLMLAFTLLISNTIQGFSFAYASERLVFRARNEMFRSMLRQDMAFFDQEKNSAGALSSMLSTDATALAGLSGTTLGTILKVSTTLIAACILGLAIGWKLSLVCIATIPLLLTCGYLRFWLLARFQSRAKAAYEGSASYACEAASSIRTVASLTRERDVWQHYHDRVAEQERKSLGSNLRSSALYAMSQSLSFLCNALCFWYGGRLIGSGEYTIFQFFVCFTAIIFGAQSAGTIFSFAPDMGKAKHAATELKRLFDRRPEIDSWSNEGTAVDHLEGYIEFRDCHFRYPTRPQQPVLRGLDLTIKPGQYVALVGPSGCGKSTTIALLERFYDVLSGTILIDGQPLSSLNITSYRNQIALVSQEPTLYKGTIRENILLGAPDESAVTDAQIISACKQANIHDFITSLPNGFNTVCGSKGSMLSGGQKQRIAIARALLRDPKVLLLDEATSALDSESEKVVQAALDAAAKGRTTIAVAHRLSTIQRADVIYVFDQGRIAEAGTHSELMRQKGRYCELVNLQNLG